MYAVMVSVACSDVLRPYRVRLGPPWHHLRPLWNGWELHSCPLEACRGHLVVLFRLPSMVRHCLSYLLLATYSCIRTLFEQCVGHIKFIFGVSCGFMVPSSGLLSRGPIGRVYRRPLGYSNLGRLPSWPPLGYVEVKLVQKARRATITHVSLRETTIV